LLRQFGNRQFHRALNWDARNAFVLVDPTVGRKCLCSLVASGFQIIHALFCTRFFVIASTRRGTNHCEHDYTEEREKKHNPEPCG